MKDFIKIIKSVAPSSLLIYGVTETVKDETKKQEGIFLKALLDPLAASVVQPVTSSIVKGISGRAINRAGREYMNKIF